MSSAERIALIHSSGAIEWKSCQTISTNLLCAYRKAFPGKIRLFSCGGWKKPSAIRKTAEEIHRFRPDRLVFVDHTPHPGTLLEPLRTLYGASPLPAVYIHVYGDFTRNSWSWVQAEQLLANTETMFICASDRQRELISRLVKRKKSVVFAPFPVDARIFRFEKELRDSWRRKLGVGDDELLIVYAGRISQQKNNLRAVTEALRFAGSRREPVRVILAGAFDDISAPFFERRKKVKGAFRKDWQRALTQLSVEERRRVRCLKQLEVSDLRGLYNAADIYLSLSLHHDEDFGMAPAEALCSGTACVLTDWGGYAGFESPGDARLVPVFLTRKGLEIDSKELQRALAFFATRSRIGIVARRDRSRRFAHGLSVDAVSRRLRELHADIPSKFQGFTSEMRKHATLSSSAAPIFAGGPRKGGLYEKIYSAYLRG